VQPAAPRCRQVSELAAAGELRRVDLFSDRDGRASAIVEECRALYDAEVAVVDQAVGRLLRDLAAMRRRTRLVVLTSDHGENLGEDGLYFEHGPSVHDADVLVPLVFAGDGVPRGVDAGVARLEDVAPTLLELLGQPVPTGLDGVSLVPRLRGERDAEPTVAQIEAGSALQVRLYGWPVSGRERHWCLNEGTLSWCTWSKDGEDTRSGLFDHRADPDLTRDLSAERPEDAQRLQAAAAGLDPERTRHRRIRTPDRSLVATPTPEGWALTPTADGDPLLASLRQLEAEIGAADAGVEPSPGAETEEALRALGYVE
jgi:arylsulfatase A-like enzyme